MSKRVKGVLGLALFLLLLPRLALAAAAPSAFADWAVVVAAGDYRDHDGRPAEIFDNARRDVAAGLIAAGFSPANILQFSILPSLYPDSKPGQTDPLRISEALAEKAKTAKGGCLYYYTSHGAPGQGAIFAAERDYVLEPKQLDKVLDVACGERPTVVVISACYSGFYIPFLKRPNRMILTAAREDRPSFGCGANDKYPYFDDCFISSLKTAGDFIALGKAAQTCVVAKEKALSAQTGSEVLPSEPQMSVGETVASSLPAKAFRR